MTIPDTINGLPVTSIGANAFQNNQSVTSITMGTNITSIGASAFQSCIGMTNVMIGNSVTSIGDGAFMACDSLAGITVNSLNPAFSSANGVLFNKNQTTLIQYPGGGTGNYVTVDDVINIGSKAFCFCGKLTSVTIGNSVASIGESAFAASISLTTVSIGTNVTSIGSRAFGSCSSLIAITVATSNPAYSSVDGVLFNKDQTALIQFPGGKAGSYMIPNSVTSIGDLAFSGCTSLTNVTIGAGLTSIGDGAFMACDSLAGITVNSLNPAFSSANGVLFNKNQTTLIRCPEGIAGSYTVPKSVTSIADFAFWYDYRLNAVYFEGNAPSLGSDWVFYDFLTVYYLPGTTGWTGSLGYIPTALWNPQPQNGASFGVRTNRFGFNITGTRNIPIVVEACTNLVNATWIPLQSTNIPSSGSFYFSDAQWTNSARFYRINHP